MEVGWDADGRSESMWSGGAGWRGREREEEGNRSVVVYAYRVMTQKEGRDGKTQDRPRDGLDLKPDSVHAFKPRTLTL